MLLIRPDGLGKLALAKLQAWITAQGDIELGSWTARASFVLTRQTSATALRRFVRPDAVDLY